MKTRQSAVVVLLAASMALTVSGGEDPFRHEMDLATCGITVNGGSTFERTKDGVSFTLAKWVDDGSRWPSICFRLPEDCSEYDRLEYGLFTHKGNGFKYDLVDRNRKVSDAYVTADVDPVQLPKYEIDMRASGCDLSHMSRITFYQSHPLTETAFEMKYIRLVSTLPRHVAELADRLEADGYAREAKEVGSLTERVRQGQLSAKAAAVHLAKAQADYTAKRLAWIRAESRRFYPKAGFALATLDGLEKLRPEGNDLLEPFRVDGWTVDLTRREREGMQVYVFAPDDRPLKDVRVAVTEFRTQGGDILPAAVAAPVGRVTIKSTKGPKSLLGEHFDPICEFTNAAPEVAARHVQALHVRFRAEEKTRSGDYAGFVVVSSTDAGEARIPVRVRVHDVTLPVSSTIRTMTSCFASDLMGARLNDFEDYVLDEYRLNPLSIYRSGYRSVEDLKDKVRRGLSYIPIHYINCPDGSHWARGGRQKGVDYVNRAAYWESLPEDVRMRYPPEEEEKAFAAFRKYVRELREAGLMKYVWSYSFDEIRAKQIPVAADLIRRLKAEFPDLRFGVTIMPNSGKGFEGLIDDWIPTVSAYDLASAERLRKTYGNTVSYYTIYMTVDMDSLASIRQELGAQAFALKADGWLVWTVSRWGGGRGAKANDRPIATAGETGWIVESFPGLNGGGSYFAMGPKGRFLPTLRAEAIRDGIEDHCLLTILKEKVEKCALRPDALKTARALLARLDSKRRNFSAAEQRRLRRLVLKLLETGRIPHSGSIARQTPQR